MENKLEKKYGLFTAICMVVGIVIGSGIFFKARNVLEAAAGDALIGVLAWLVGGAVMAVLAVTFGVMATKYEKVGGVVDYAEATCGHGYAYFFGWFLSTIYYPAMTSVLAWVSARYTLVIFGFADAPNSIPTAVGTLAGEEFAWGAMNSPHTVILALIYLIAIYFMNTIAPKVAGKFQVSTTVIKLIPIVFIAIVGTIIGLCNGTLVKNFTYIHDMVGAAANGAADLAGVPSGYRFDFLNLFKAICCTVFAYEGWIIATAINAEIKDAKKNLPIALGVGAVVIVVAYALFYIGTLGIGEMEMLMGQGSAAAYEETFKTAGAAIINVLIVISCLGTLNGLMLGCTRGFYALAARNQGIAPDTLGEVDRRTNMPHNSAMFALLFCALWLAYFIGGQFFGWFGSVDVAGSSLEGFWDGSFAFDSSELPIITIYPLYIPILIVFMVKSKDLHPVKRFVLPILSLIGIGVVVAAAIFSHKLDIAWYLIVFVIMCGIGMLFYRPKSGISVMDKLGAAIKSLRKSAPANDSEDATPDVTEGAEESTAREE